MLGVRGHSMNSASGGSAMRSVSPSRDTNSCCYRAFLGRTKSLQCAFE